MSVPTIPLIQKRPDVNNQQLEFFWSAPLSDGGSPITSYYLSDGTNNYTLPVTDYYNLTGLTNGTTYSFTLAASNANGLGEASYFTPVQPGIEPGPPTLISTLNMSNNNFQVVFQNSSNLGSNTRLLGTLLTAIPLDANSNLSTNSSLYIYSSVPDGFASAQQIGFLTLNSNYNYKIKLESINDPGYSLTKVFTSTLTTTVNYVTSNLMFYLDAGNSSSYSGSGTTWTDLTGNGRNATLINSPTYSSSNQGYISFLDTTYQHATIANIGSLSNWTVEVWSRLTKSISGKVASLVTNQFGSQLNYSLGTNNAPGSYNMVAGFHDGNWRNTNGFAPNLNIWIQFVGTYDGSRIVQYSNAVFNTSTLYTGTPQSGGEIRIARRWDGDAVTTGNFFACDISVVRIYSRALSATEVLQNFNSIKSRYSL